MNFMLQSVKFWERYSICKT